MVYRGRQLHNDERDLDAIATGYESKLQELDQNWLPYALQKDAIQNSWDARKPQNGEWKTEISIAQTSNGTFLVITDEGTSGLIGHLWNSEEEQIELLGNELSTENLAFFLSSNFSNKSSTSGGKRGRGKSLFLVASKDKTFYFESLRSDGERVYGGQYISSVSKSIGFELTQDRQYLTNNTSAQFKALPRPGTRIYISNPHDSILEAIASGLLMDFIEKTWWEIIKKFHAKVLVFEGGVERIAQVPEYYSDDYLASSPNLKVKEYPNIPINLNGEKHRVKRVKLVYDPMDNMPGDIKGIAIQRNGMTIERKLAETLVKEEGMQKVYGWVELEPSLEQAMYHLEDVEHLGFNWIKNPAAKLRSEIMIKTRDFAREVKIIESEMSKEHSKHKKIEDNVAKRINKFLSGIGFKGFSTGRGPITPHTKNKELPLRLSMTGFKTSTSIKRVGNHDSIKAVAEAVNTMSSAINLRMRVWIVSKDGKTTRSLEKDVVLHPNKTFELGWETIEITEKEFPRGDYSFRAKIIVMQETNISLPRIGRLEKGNDLIRAGISFCVDKDPVESGFIKFMGTDKDIYLESYPEDGAIVVEYGTEHPYIAQFMDPSKETELERFLMQNGIVLALNEILAEDVAADNPKLFKDLKTENLDPADVLPQIIMQVDRFLRI